MCFVNDLLIRFFFHHNCQDTVVSLHALSRFSSLLQQSGMDVEVKLKTEFTEKTVNVNSNNKLLVQRVEVRSLKIMPCICVKNQNNIFLLLLLLLL